MKDVDDKIRYNIAMIILTIIILIFSLVLYLDVEERLYMIPMIMGLGSVMYVLTAIRSKKECKKTICILATITSLALGILMFLCMFQLGIMQG